MFSICWLQEGHTVHIGGLVRLDIENSSVDSIYVTVWASSNIPLHMGKTENAEEMLKEHFGNQLQVCNQVFESYSCCYLLMIIS